LTDQEFIVHVADILTSCKYSPLEQLAAIKLRYIQMTFPEHQLTKESLDLLARIEGTTNQ
jgi:hypothetical protein